jgi:hypothetical protein
VRAAKNATTSREPGISISFIAQPSHKALDIYTRYYKLITTIFFGYQ